MRVLLVISEMGVGGAERIVAELARGLDAGGDAVAVAGAPGELDPLLEAASVRRHRLASRGRSPLGLAGSALTLRQAVRAFRPDVIHAHNVKATAICAAARATLLRGRPPLIATFHGVPPAEYRAAARILRAARLVACVSDDLAAGLAARGFPERRLRVVANSVEVPAPLGTEWRHALEADLGLDGAPVVAIVGRLVPQKAHRRFLEAAALVHQSLPRARFLIVGDGPLRAELEAEAAARGLGEAVVFTGIRSDVPALLERADVVAFASDWEGMPLVALEALAAATPVVTTAVEGMGELLEGDAGVIVERAAVPLAEAILALLRDPDARARMGAAGRARVEARHSPAAMLASYRALYSELAVGFRRP